MRCRGRAPDTETKPASGLHWHCLPGTADVQSGVERPLLPLTRRPLEGCLRRAGMAGRWMNLTKETPGLDRRRRLLL